jgi:hypothetical protein
MKDGKRAKTGWASLDGVDDVDDASSDRRRGPVAYFGRHAVFSPADLSREMADKTEVGKFLTKHIEAGIREGDLDAEAVSSSLKILKPKL